MNGARIKLADAMDIDHTLSGEEFGKRWGFSPFNDANDDYAVLDWMHGHDKQMDFEDAVYEREAWHYRIGDWARAACKVLEIEDQPLP